MSAHKMYLYLQQYQFYPKQVIFCTVFAIIFTIWFVENISTAKLHSNNF